MSEGPAAPGAFEPIEARAVDVAAIERELDELMRSPGEDGSRPEVVTRACMSNLLLFAPGQSEAATLAGELAAIAERHPSRIVLLVDDAGGGDVEAFVSAVCHGGSAGRQICSEHVEIHAPSTARRRLPSIARPLLIGDLPTALWWTTATPPQEAGDLFDELAAMSAHVLFDSAPWDRPAHALAALDRWVATFGERAGVSDLAWSRLRPWRSLATSALDPACVPGALQGVREVAIEHGASGLSEALLFAGWLAGRLGWQAEAGSLTSGSAASGFASPSGRVRFEARSTSGAGGIARVRIEWQAAGSGAGKAEIAAQEDGHLALVGEGDSPSRVVATSSGERARLVARELPELGHDAIYREALASAGAIARGLVG